MTMSHIQTTKLTSSQSSIVFSNIPQDYNDLYITVSGRGDSTVNLIIKFNGGSIGTSTNRLQGDGSSAVGRTGSNNFGFVNDPNFTTNAFASIKGYIPRYTSSNTKTYGLETCTENGATLAYLKIEAGLWSSTDAITSIELEVSSGNMIAETAASLYGITAGGDGTVSTA